MRRSKTIGCNGAPGLRIAMEMKLGPENARMKQNYAEVTIKKNGLEWVPDTQVNSKQRAFQFLQPHFFYSQYTDIQMEDYTHVTFVQPQITKIRNSMK